MWSDNNSNTYDLDSGRRCMCYSSYCHTSTVPSLCAGCHATLHTSKPVTQWYTNVLPNPTPTSLLNYHLAPQNNMSGFSHVTNPAFHIGNDHEVSEQMATNEVDSWLLLNPDYSDDQNNGNCSLWAGNQYQGQFNQLQIRGSQQVNYDGAYGMFPVQTSQGIQQDFTRAVYSSMPASLYNASLPQMGAGIVPETTQQAYTGDFTREWGLNHFSLLPSHPGNLREKAVGSHSNSTSISSEGTRQLISLDDSKKPSKDPPMSRQERVLRYFEKKQSRKYEKKIQTFSRKTYAQTPPRIQLISVDDSKKPSKYPPMSRQERVRRYFEKKKSRKYEKKIQCLSRKTYAQTRPRIQGRFVRRSQTDTKTIK